MPALVPVTKPCAHCDEPYTIEVESEWAAVVALWGICPACVVAQEHARRLLGDQAPQPQEVTS